MRHPYKSILRDKEFHAIAYMVLYYIDDNYIRVQGPYREMTICAAEVELVRAA